MNGMEQDQVRAHIRQVYGDIARAGGTAGCCSGGGVPGTTGGCGSPAGSAASETAVRLGYSEAEVSSAPEGSNLGLGCGNPQAIAELGPGETVIDLGSGGGFDCFLAARQLQGTGRVIGVDMTPEMVSRARSNAERGGYANVEFRLGEIEHLPVADGTADVILSNCVINLSPDKRQVFAEAYRVLKPGGRLAVSDVVALMPLPVPLARDMALYSGCVSGAATVEELRSILQEQGFTDVSVVPKEELRGALSEWAPGTGVEDYVSSAVIRARKPG